MTSAEKAALAGQRPPVTVSKKKRKSPRKPPVDLWALSDATEALDAVLTSPRRAGALLRDVRLALGISQEDLAKAVGVTRWVVRHRELTTHEDRTIRLFREVLKLARRRQRQAVSDPPGGEVQQQPQQERAQHEDQK